MRLKSGGGGGGGAAAAGAGGGVAAAAAAAAAAGGGGGIVRSISKTEGLAAMEGGSDGEDKRGRLRLG